MYTYKDVYIHIRMSVYVGNCMYTANVYMYSVYVCMCFNIHIVRHVFIRMSMYTRIICTL